jgi:hypothetical protein
VRFLELVEGEIGLATNRDAVQRIANGANDGARNNFNPGLGSGVFYGPFHGHKKNGPRQLSDLA